MIKNTYEKEYSGKEEWFKNHNKLVIVRYNDQVEGKIVGAFQNDNSALEYVEKRMDREGKVLTALEMPWITLEGYYNCNNHSYKHKFIRNACFRNTNGLDETDTYFWFEVVEDNCLLNHIKQLKE